MDEGYFEMIDELFAEAQTFAGFIGTESLCDANGFGISVLYLHYVESIGKWIRNAKHIEANRTGKELWYSGYRVRIAMVERVYGME